MKLIGSHTSPFVRMICVLCSELDIDYKLDVIPPFSKMTEKDIAYIADKNPLKKIPVLIDGDNVVIDSRIISSYLAKKNNVYEEPTLDEENIISIIYGVLDAGILRFMLAQDGIDLNSGYMKKSYERIESGLCFLNDQDNLGNDFGFCEISLICCLEWFSKREIFDWQKFTAIKEIYDMYKDRKSFVTTRIPK